jgi:hypothetical protein
MNNKTWWFHLILVFCVLFTIVTPSFSTAIQGKNIFTTLMKKTQDPGSVSIDEIVPKDDAFHGTTSFPSIEWWYFDSMFVQNYSAHVGFKIITYQGLNLLKPSINIYQGTTLIANETKIITPFDFKTSQDQPYIEIHSTPVMKFNKTNYEKNGEWEYHICYEIDGVGVDLQFISETKGWRYETPHEGWTVAIPQGKVSGTISLNDTEIKVNGRGYHDHNWNFSLKTPARGWSWYWGKITGETLNLAWAEIKETGVLPQTFSDKLGVLNTQEDEFVVIDPEHIKFSAESFVFKDNRFIPTRFHLTLDQDDVFIDVTLTSVELHRSDPSVMTLHYWRYFVSVTGIISYKDTTEYLDGKLQIMEYMRFF